MAGGVAIEHALQDISEVGERLDGIELGGFNEGADDSPAVGASV